MGNAAERIIAVDWALSKDRWEEAKAKMEDVTQDDQDEADDSDSEDGSIAHDEESHSSSEESVGGDEDQMDVDDNGQQHGRPQLPPPETGTTLFVRNVPFEATDDDLRTL